MKSNRKNDTMRSKVISDYSYNCIYPHLFGDFQPVYDAKRQRQGIDVIVGDMLIDEKAAINYMNKNLSTYSFEISALPTSEMSDNNIRYSGWFVNKKLLTTHYMLIYPHSTKVHYKDFNHISQLDSLEYILVEKKKLKDTVNYLFPNLNNIYKDFMHEGRKSLPLRSVRYAMNRNDWLFKLVKTTTLKEQPVNLIIPKTLLIKLSDLHYIHKIER